ncbi:MAG TPA: hypothetical protein PL112_17485 [Candidatus Obscuribacter sp.]|nr:hypothetical protein [Candidatus Obscuribacter sp.]
MTRKGCPDFAPSDSASKSGLAAQPLAKKRLNKRQSKPESKRRLFVSFERFEFSISIDKDSFYNGGFDNGSFDNGSFDNGFGGEFKNLPRGGIEPPTQGFSVLCSTD